MVMTIVMRAALIVLALQFIIGSSFNPKSDLRGRRRAHLFAETLMSDPSQPWYSHSNLGRDRTAVMETPREVAMAESSRFILVGGKEMYHSLVDPSDPRSSAEPLYLTFEQLQGIIGAGMVEKSLLGQADHLIAWVGSLNGSNYFVCHVAETEIISSTANTKHSAGLREFGDRLLEATDAGILSTANGLVEFHKSHPFCSKCGSKTVAAKVGACRRCTQTSCKTSVYPRIDVAAIMLITSPCENYALMGRKTAWPEGRYSTLAGFCEVGETIEQACVREVFEESGVAVDSIKFICSQPWPFPRSLMVGFRGKACETPGQSLPTIVVDGSELQDVQWFHRDFVKARLEGGSTALDFVPNEHEREFHVPGPSSLGRLLITQWATES